MHRKNRPLCGALVLSVLNMSNKQFVLTYKGLHPAIDPGQAPTRLGVTALSIRETVRSKIPSDKSKYDRNEKVDELYRKWSQSSGFHPEDRYETVILHFYELYKPKILAIARKYRALSPVFDDDDLQQTGLLGIFQALTKYDHAEHIDMRFSTYLEWSVRNVFQRTIGYTDKFVEIYDRNDNLICVMSYREFLVKKKAITSEGHRYVIRSRQCYLSEVYHLSVHNTYLHGEVAEDAKWHDEDDDRSSGARSNG